MATVLSIVLGAVFVVAGASKIAAGRTWVQQASDLGAPRSIALVLPWFELAVGAWLIVQLARRAAGVVALVTLLAFTSLLVLRLRQGSRPPCACFGAWSARPIGWGHVARNAVFAALAVGVIIA